MRILTDAQETLLKDARNLLNDLRASLIQFGASAEDHETLAQSIRQLDELFLLVVVGEFNSGKSAFINALLGQKLLKEGVTPTTTQINVVRFGETQERHVESDNQQVISAPVELLAELNIVDTPGTNAIMRQHEAITQQFVPRSDLVLFVTSADRPFTESEREFLEKIRDWGKKVVIVLNKIDLFQSREELDQVVSFIDENARSLLGISPEIFPVSARLALRAKLGESALWKPSLFEALERYIQDTLDEKGRLTLKFMNPLGVGSHLVNQYLEVTGERLDLLETDFTTLQDVDAQLSVYQQDMHRDFEYRMADIENILFEMERRGQDYFD
jgi:small GTP-binding protein